MTSPGSTTARRLARSTSRIAVHLDQGDQDAAGRRDGASGEPGPSSPGREGHASPVARPHHGRHLLGRLGQDHGLGQPLVDGAVVLVEPQVVLFPEDVLLADKGDQSRNEAVGRHLGPPVYLYGCGDLCGTGTETDKWRRDYYRRGHAMAAWIQWLVGYGEGEVEGAALAQGALGPDAAAVALHQ